MSSDSEESLGKQLLQSWHRIWLLRMIAYGLGAVLILAGLGMAAYGEYSGIRTAQALESGASNVVTVASDKIDPANDGKLVHVVGEAATKDTLSDPEFGVNVNAIRLSRKTEMYQWQEKKETKKKGNNTETTYNYDPIWSAKLIDSKNYKTRGHDNPPQLPFEDKSWQAKEVTVGAFALAPGLIDKIKGDERLTVTDPGEGKLPNKVKVADGIFYFGEDAARPVVGDSKTEFKVVKPGTLSVVAKQGKTGLEPFDDGAGHTHAYVQTGNHSAQEMFEGQGTVAGVMTWGFRLIGFILLAAGIYLVSQPRVDSADTMPVVGEVLALGAIPFGVVMGLLISMVVSGAILVTHRPIFTPALLIGAAGIFLVARFLGARQQAKNDGSAQLAPPAAKLARRIRKLGGRFYVYDEGKTVSISLDGEKFTDDFLAELDALPTVTDLTLYNTAIKGDGLTKFRDAKALTSLSITGPVSPQGIQVIGSMTNLTRLTLRETKLTDQGLMSLRGLSKLEDADLSGTLITDAGLANVKGWVNLKSFWLGDSPVTGAGLDNLKDMRSLERVRLSGNKLTDPGLAGLKNMKTLKELSITMTEIDGRGLGYLQALTLLEKLELDHTKVDDRGLSFLAKLPKLRELNLQRTKVTDAGLAQLKLIPALEKLELYRTGITDKGIAQLAGKTTITELCIDRTQVTDGCLPAIARLSNLRELHLDHTGVTDAGLVHLKGLTNLNTLTTKGTKVTKKGRDDLRASLPGTEVDTLGGMEYDENGWRGLVDAIETRAEELEAAEQAQQPRQPVAAK
jgi:Leucine-rich repeat (LRR) protein